MHWPGYALTSIHSRFRHPDSESIMTDSDFMSIWPHLDAPAFSATYLPLPQGVTEEELRETNLRYGDVVPTGQWNHA